MRAKLTLLIATALAAGATTAAAAADRPDLVVKWLTSPPSALAPGEAFDAAAVIRNVGDRAARRSRTAFHLDRSPRNAAGRVPLGTVPTRRLVPGRRQLRALRVTLPADLRRGEYFLVVCPDAERRVRESDERHNCVASADYVAVDVQR